MIKNKNQVEDFKMPLIDHFIEFRKRFIIALLSFIFIFVICWSYKSQILKAFTYPILQNSSIKYLISTKITEVFASYLEICFISAFILSIPILILQIILFISPALKKSEKINVYTLIIASCILFVIGLLFAYFIIIPIIFDFFLSFQNIKQINLSLNIEPKISEYINLMKSMLISFALAFQLPIILIILLKIGVVSIKNLQDNRRYAILFSFIIGAILTPPDVVSQIILALPLMFLYEISILYAHITDFQKSKLLNFKIK